MPKKSSKPKHPSYEDGELRDPKIAEMQERAAGDPKTALWRLVKRAVKPTK
nr:hypothetical protein 2 [Desulfobacterales bacterium]